MRLLIVEDEENLAYFIKKGLVESGYIVDHAKDGEEALYYYSLNEYDCIILDLNIPKIDGLDVLKKIREQDKYTKILILSARVKVDERVEGLDNGANDYLCKPFDFLELEARIRTLLRMSYIQKSILFQCGDLELNMKTKVISIKDKQVFLTNKELMLFECLFLRQGEIVSHEELIEHCWDGEHSLFSNVLKYHIHSINRKLLNIDPKHEYVKNFRGRGYMMQEVPSEI